MAIGPITNVGVVGAPASVAPTSKAAGPGFADTLANALDSARALEDQAATSSAQFATGDGSVGIHETVIAAEKANVSLRFAVTLKNKVIEAYRELMNTPV